MSFAVIKTGGKQYIVKEGDKLLVEKIDRPVGEEFTFEEVLLIGNSSLENTQIGQPLVAGAKVQVRILNQTRGEKKIVFRYKRKTRYKKKKGHRQPYTQIEILKISA